MKLRSGKDAAAIWQTGTPEYVRSVKRAGRRLKNRAVLEKWVKARGKKK